MTSELLNMIISRTAVRMLHGNRSKERGAMSGRRAISAIAPPLPPPPIRNNNVSKVHAFGNQNI